MMPPILGVLALATETSACRRLHVSGTLYVGRRGPGWKTGSSDVKPSVDTPIEVHYHCADGMLPYLLRQPLAG
jgi:hypothetical protein